MISIPGTWFKFFPFSYYNSVGPALYDWGHIILCITPNNRVCSWSIIWNKGTTVDINLSAFLSHPLSPHSGTVPTSLAVDTLQEQPEKLEEVFNVQIWGCPFSAELPPRPGGCTCLQHSPLCLALSHLLPLGQAAPCTVSTGQRHLPGVSLSHPSVQLAGFLSLKCCFCRGRKLGYFPSPSFVILNLSNGSGRYAPSMCQYLWYL